nr:ATP synthase F1 subunit epsilon [uncultured Acetatifactor sp.]
MAADKSFRLRVITPDRVFYEGENVDMVEFNTTEGQIGILPGHIPLTVIVRPGTLHIYEGEQERQAALHSGFAEIMPEEVTILAETIEWPEEIDLERAQAALQRARQRLMDKEPKTDLARAETALYRAMARIQVLK